jgi:SulP family sulfate permease
MKLHVARTDIEGGVIATLFALPIELIYGRLAIAPLGPQHFSDGIHAALWTCVMTGFLATIFRGTPGIINGTGGKIALVLAGLTATLMKMPEIASAANPTALIFALIFMCTIMAGAAQCLFALGRLSRSLKFIPYPVIAGTMVGSAIALAKTALTPTLGIEDPDHYGSLLGAWHPLSTMVTIATLLLCLYPLKLFGRIPFMLTALVGGSLLHYLMSLVFGSGHLGTTWSTIHGLMPTFSFYHFALDGGLPSLLVWAPTVFPYALAIAAIASMESMLCLPTVEVLSLRKRDGGHELWSQGLSNIAAGFMGGFPSEGVGARSSANVKAGGKTRMSAIAYSVALALLIIFGSELLGRIPEAVTAGLILYLAYTLIDDGTRRLLIQIFSMRKKVSRSQYRLLWANAVVLTVVAMVAVFRGMLQATAVGVVAAMLLFILTSMKPVIRNIVSAELRRSLKVRNAEATALLEKEGGRIRIIELDGVLFFGTAEMLAMEISELPSQVTMLILDFTRVKEIDATAGRTLFQLARRFQAAKRTLMVCGASQSLNADFATSGLRDLVPPDRWHHDCDHALEHAEEILLVQLGFSQSHVTLLLGETMLAAGLDADEVTALEQFLEHRELPGHVVVFSQGDLGNSLYVSASGVIDIRLPLRHGKHKRVASFAPGVIVGEMAFLEDLPRSAEGCVTAPTLLWELTRQRFDDLTAAFPTISHKIMLNLSRGLSERLRRTTQNLRAASANSDFNAQSGRLLPGQVERRRHPR